MGSILKFANCLSIGECLRFHESCVRIDCRSECARDRNNLVCLVILAARTCLNKKTVAHSFLRAATTLALLAAWWDKIFIAGRAALLLCATRASTNQINTNSNLLHIFFFSPSRLFDAHLAYALQLFHQRMLLVAYQLSTMLMSMLLLLLVLVLLLLRRLRRLLLPRGRAQVGC